MSVTAAGLNQDMLVSPCEIDPIVLLRWAHVLYIGPTKKQYLLRSCGDCTLVCSPIMWRDGRSLILIHLRLKKVRGRHNIPAGRYGCAPFLTSVHNYFL